MTTYTINVTQEDIADGKPCVANACPLALAIRRATGKYTSVGTIFAMVENIPGKLPEVAYNFRRDFDMSRPTSPFSFELDLPDAPL